MCGLLADVGLGLDEGFLELVRDLVADLVLDVVDLLRERLDFVDFDVLLEVFHHVEHCREEVGAVLNKNSKDCIRSRVCTEAVYRLGSSSARAKPTVYTV